MHFFYYLLISLSTLGYGFFLNNTLKLDSKNLGIIGFFGIFFLILLSYVSSFFIAHGYLFNSLILIIGLIFLSFFLKKKLSKKKGHNNFFYYFFSLIYIYFKWKKP